MVETPSVNVQLYIDGALLTIDELIELRDEARKAIDAIDKGHEFYEIRGARRDILDDAVEQALRRLVILMKRFNCTPTSCIQMLQAATMMGARKILIAEGMITVEENDDAHAN